MSFYTQIRLFALVLGALLVLTAEPASATKRVALVVGNSTYQNAPLLPNPANDAAAIAATLKGAGFDVVELEAQSHRDGHETSPEGFC